MSALLPPPIIYVADYKVPIPEDISHKYLTLDVVEYSELLPEEESKAFLWSRLILQSVTQQFQPSMGRTLKVVENYTNSLTLEGGFYNYCSIDIREKYVALALSILPINICLTLFKDTHFWEELVFRRFFLIGLKGSLILVSLSANCGRQKFVYLREMILRSD